MKRDRVLIYRDRMLPHSETFVLAQGEGLTAFEAFYAGSARVPGGIAVPAERSLFVNDGTRFGRMGEILFKMFGLVSRPHLARLEESRPLLVHAHFGPDGVLAQTLAEALQVPLVVTFHGYDATMTEAALRAKSFVEKKFLVRRERLVAGCARFIAISDFIRKRLIESGIPEQKIVVHYIGVDLETLKPSDVERKEVALFVGRLVEKKGCAYLIRAMQRVQESLPDLELVVIGDGPLRGELEEAAARSLTRYRFLGAQPNDVVREWMNRSRIFSVPSVTAASGDAEGFGIVFAEAQAMGLPVVSFASGGIPEAVADGETGFLLPEKDWEGLAERIVLLCRDQPLWRRMSQAGRRRVAENFDLKRQCRILEKIYAEVAQGSSHDHAP